MSDYWTNCLEQAFEDAGVTVTPGQLKTVVETVEGAHEVYGEVHGYHNIPDPVIEENNSLKRELQRERSLVPCRECNGSGIYSIAVGVSHWSTGTCWKCNGNKKVMP